MMKTLNRNSILLTVSLATILSLSAFVPTLAAASVNTNANWDGPMGNYPYNLDYSAQTVVSPTNVADLQLSWVFPIPAAPASITAGLGGFLSPQGDIVTPLLVNGIVYTITNFQLLLALDASNGKIIWEKDLSTINAAGVPGGNVTGAGHYHSLYFTHNVRGVALVWVACGGNCIMAFNALTGDLNLAFDPHIGDSPIPGNFGTSYVTKTNGGFSHDWLDISESGVLITGSAASEATDTGRGFFEAFDVTVTPPKLLWEQFTIPPQDGSQPNWAIDSVGNMTHAWIFQPKDNTAIDLKALPAATLHTMLYGDWGNFGFNGTRSFAGSATGWGGAWAIDPKTNIAYIATDQASPDGNATFRPGPNLWSDSVLAVNLQTGQINWAFQTTSHDLYDWDCSWGVVLTNATVGGVNTEVVIKGCKNGYFYEMNAATGALIWAFNPPNVVRAPFSTLAKWNDPTNHTQMYVRAWPNYPAVTPFIQNPWYLGAIESNPAYDPTTNTAVVVAFNQPVSQCSGDVGPTKGIAYGGGGPCHVTNTLKAPANAINSTMWSINANTGAAICHYYISDIGFRGGISITNGLVIIPRSDGYIDFVNEATCALVSQKFIDGGLITQMAIGSDTKGNIQLVMPASGAIGSLALGFAGFPTQPGYIFSLSLPASALTTQVTTTTVVHTQTATTTATVVSNTGTAGGVSSTVFYAVVAVAAIAIIAAGALAMRRRGPAS